MKSEGIAPALKKCGDKRCIETSSNDKKNKQNSRYVRALLGVASKVEYLNALDKNNFSEKVIVNIREESKNIERMDSPIFLKLLIDVFLFAQIEFQLIYMIKLLFFLKKCIAPKKIKLKILL